MKRLVSLVLVFLFTLSVLPVFAEGTEGLENAILTVKSRLDIPEEYTEFKSDVTIITNAPNRYMLTWSLPDDSRKSIRVVIDEDGVITSYSNEAIDMYYYNTAVKLPKFSAEQLKQMGYDFFEKANPDIVSEFPREKAYGQTLTVGSSWYAVGCRRCVNGITYSDDLVSIAVSPQTGEIINMLMTYTDCDNNESAENIITQQQAAEEYNEYSPMMPKYVSADDKTAVIVYSPDDTGLFINAKTGEMAKNTLRRGAEPWPVVNAAGETDAAAYAAGEKGLTVNEQLSVDQIGGLLTKDELCAAAEAITELGVETEKLNSCTYEKRTYEDGDVEYFARLSYNSPEGDDAYYMNLVLNAENGALEDYRKGTRGRYFEKATLTEAQAYENAKAFVSKYSDGLYDHTVYNGDIQDKVTIVDGENPTYYFSFCRQENGIPYHSNYISVQVDARTNEIISYNKKWNKKLEFESPENIITPEQAFEKLMEFSSFELRYLPESYDSKDKMILAYGLKTAYPYILAKTGEHVTYDGEPYVEVPEVVMPTDISGHYAEEQITALLTVRAIQLPEGETLFRPDDPITQEEMLWFIEALNGRIPVVYDGETVYRAGILDKDESIDKNALCKREDGAKYIVRAAEYDAAAELTDIFKTGFADEDMISDGLIGYVAIAKGLKIIGGNPDNTFDPQGTLTRADAAIMVYNCLSAE